METAEIRRRWLAFFERNGHTVVPSAPLIHDDPNLLFVNAGMVPFKPYFLGQETPQWARATSVQKCVRTGDIEEVGKTSRHGTFFQMNGNFAFGDYFKEGAITLAWELITTSQEQGGYGLDADLIWPTVYDDDDEAFAIWRDGIGVPEARITRRGKLDNYWHMGVPGPGGPCSEIYLDRGPEYGREGGPAVDEDPTSSSGTSSSCRRSSPRSAPRTTSTSPARCPSETSTPGWGWSGWRRCSRASTTSTRSTRST